MQLLLTIMGAVVGAVIGALLQFYLPIWRDNRRYSRKAQLLGDWLSSWQPSNKEPHAWTSERVHIDVHFGKLKLSNEANSHGYQWAGEGELFESDYFYGTYYSIKRGANSKGVFAFYLLPQGDAIVGQALGTDAEGGVLHCRWAMGRDLTALEKAKRWIEDH